MIIKKVAKHVETREERAERLYQVGNVIECHESLYLVTEVHSGFVLYDLKTGQPVSAGYETLSGLANGDYYPSDKLVTALTYETED